MKPISIAISTPALAATSLALAIGTLCVAMPALGQDEERRDIGTANPIEAPREVDPRARAILAKSSETYRNLKAWHVEGRFENYGRYTKTVTADFVAPNKLHVFSYEAKGIQTKFWYEDGKLTTLRDFDEILEYNDSPLQATTPNPRLAFGNALGQYLSGFFAGEENVFGRQDVRSVKYAGESTVNKIPVHVIEATTDRRGQLTTIKYFIGKEDNLLQRVIQPTVNQFGEPDDYVETYNNQKAESALKLAQFKFAPPIGAAKVQRFSKSRGIAVNLGEKPFAIANKAVDGRALSLDDYKGKVVLLDFWATWCAPCRAELPNLKANYEKYKNQGFDVLGISFDETATPVAPFIKKEAIGWRNIYDGYWHGPVAKQYNVRYVPTTILVGRDGKVVAISPRGPQLENAIQAALAAGSEKPQVATATAPDAAGE